jgi:hypothetical protein
LFIAGPNSVTLRNGEHDDPATYAFATGLTAAVLATAICHYRYYWPGVILLRRVAQIRHGMHGRAQGDARR